MSSYFESVLLVSGEYKSLAPWVGTLAALIASLVAAEGIGTWKKQLRGTTRHVSASKFLRALFVYRNALLTLNEPRYREEELAISTAYSAKDLSGIMDIDEWIKEWAEDGARHRYHNHSCVFNYRVENLNKRRAQIENLLLDLEVSGVHGIGECLSDIDALTYSLFISTKIALQYWHAEVSSNDVVAEKVISNEAIDQLRKAGIRYYRLDIKKGGSEEFASDLKKPIERLEKLVRKYM